MKRRKAGSNDGMSGESAHVAGANGKGAPEVVRGALEAHGVAVSGRCRARVPANGRRYFAASRAARISASLALSARGMRGALASSSVESFEGFFSYSA